MSETTPELNSPQINADLRLHVRRIVLWRLTAKVHLALFIMVNLLVLSINWAFSPGNLWWLWMVTGWGLVFSAHVFYAVTRARVTPFQWHIFLYISVNLYLLFINLYTAHRITWCWIPWLSWSVLLVVNIVIKRDLVHSTEPLIIYAVLISDTDGKTLIQTEQRPQFLADVLHMNEANIELIPMFINAMLQFSKEINMLDCNDFRLQSKKLKVVCYAERDLICTGFISFESNSSTAREVFRRILIEFQRKFGKEIETFRKVGLATPFESYKLDVQKIIEVPLIGAGQTVAD